MSEVSAADAEILWRTGNLRYKLHSDQRMVYDKYRAWQKYTTEVRERGEELPGKFSRVWITNCSRRWGKDYLGLLIALEDGLRRPNAAITYATAFLKDLGEILIPLSKQILSDCPAHLKPQYKDAFRGLAQGLYMVNGSVIRFVGIEKSVDSLRGRWADSIFISEGAYVDSLDTTVNDVLMPQLLGRPWSTIMMNSTPPKSANEWITDFVPDAEERGAYAKRTLFDCPIYTDAEKAEFIKTAGGIDSERAQREYMCQMVRTETLVVVPEFKKDLHVREFEPPAYGLTFTVIDPAVSDLAAINFGVWDFINNRLLIQDEFAQRNANTSKIVDVIRQKELELWGSATAPVRYWNGKTLIQAPFMRYSDTDHRLIIDLNQLHGVKCAPVKKDDAEAALHALRNAFHQNQIWIHPRCEQTIAQIEGGVWNKSRNSYQRTDKLGHLDNLDCLKYMWRHVPRSQNPFPPGGWVAKQTQNSDMIHVLPSHMSHQNSIVEKLNKLFPSTWSRGGSK